MEIQKNSLLIGETIETERAVGWHLAAALKGPCFLVLEEFARNPLLRLLPAVLDFLSYFPYG